MINRLMEKKRQEEGFTLIELLIVVIILGILAAVVVFGVSTFRDDSVEKACQTDRKQVETAVAGFLAKNGHVPSENAAAGEDPSDTVTTTTTTGSSSTNTDTTTNDVLTGGNYLKSYPQSDDYRIDYTPTGSGNQYTVKGVESDSTADYPGCNP